MNLQLCLERTQNNYFGKQCYHHVKSKSFWANLLVAVVGIALLIWGVNASLRGYTHHGDNIQVPDLSRLSYEEAVRRLESTELGYEILDALALSGSVGR